MFTVTCFLSRDSRICPTASANALRRCRRRRMAASPTERWMPFEPELFATTCKPSWSSRSRTSRATRAALDDAGRRARVEVEHHRGGVPGVRGAGLGCVQLERREVGRPDQAREVLDRAGLDLGIGVERDGLQPGRAVFRATLFEESLALHAVGQPHHRERPVLEMGEQRWRHPGVVIDHLTFGEAGRGVQDLVEVGQSEFPSADLNVGLARRSSRTLGPSGHDLRR